MRDGGVTVGYGGENFLFKINFLPAPLSKKTMAPLHAAGLGAILWPALVAGQSALQTVLAASIG